MAKLNLPSNEDLNDFNDNLDPDELMDKQMKALYEDESDLRKEINKLKRWEKKLKAEHEQELFVLRLQIQDLFKKNWELTEANNIFARGLEQLKQEQRIITQSHVHHVIDMQGIKSKIDELTKTPAFGPDTKRRIVSMITLKANSRNEATEILITTEHIEKVKKPKEEDK